MIDNLMTDALDEAQLCPEGVEDVYGHGYGHGRQQPWGPVHPCRYAVGHQNPAGLR